MATMLFPIVSAPITPGHPNMTLVNVSIGEPETVDPGWCYDTASATIIMNVYDTLVWFNKTSMVDFIPSLATHWYFNDTGMYWNFTIRKNVKFHNGADLTPSDIEYSFERWMVLDHAGGPTWMIFEPLLGCDYWDTGDTGFADKVNASVKSDTDNVYFYYQAGAFPPMIFLQTIAQSWASILDKNWSIAQGCWDGDFANWETYHDPTVSPIDAAGSKMCGTGPYKLDYWIHGVEYCIVKNDEYWGPWPADESTGQACDDFVDRYIARKVDEWSTRKLEFAGGDADLCYVPRMYMRQLMESWDPTEVYLGGIECTPDLPTLTVDGIFFNYNISNGQFKYPVSPYLSGLDYGQLSPTGICPDFFSDEHVRKAFAYSIDYETYIEAAFLGEAVYPSTPSIFGLDYRRPETWYDDNAYQFNLTKAEEEWKLAWGGALWGTGFKLTITYNTGNIPRKTMADMLEANVESMNGIGAKDFSIETLAVDWGSTYIPQLFTRQLPMFIIGWLADYPDPHNFYQPFMAKYGAFSGVATQGYYNTEVEALLDEEIGTTNETRRQEIFYRLQEIYIEDCPSVCVDQAEGRHWNRDWVKGWYLNQIYPGTYVYHTWISEVGSTPIDLDATATITPSVEGTKLKVTPDGNNVTKISGTHPATFDIHMKRIDTKAGGVYVVFSLKENDTWTGLIPEVLNMSDIVLPFGPIFAGEEWTWSILWDEIQHEPLPGGNSTNTVRDYEIFGSVDPRMAGFYDEHPENDIVSAGIVHVKTLIGDANLDGIVELKDFFALSAAFGSKPGHERWNPLADINEDKIVELKDFFQCSKHFGEKLTDGY